MVWTKDCCDSDPSCTILEPHDLGAGAGASASVLVWGRAQVLGTQVDRTGWLWVLGS